MSAIQDDAVAKPADAMSVAHCSLSFLPSSLKGIESSVFDWPLLRGHDLAFDPVRESKRLTENAEARQRALRGREARLAARKAEAETPVVYTEAGTARAASLVQKLSEIEIYSSLKDYPRRRRV